MLSRSFFPLCADAGMSGLGAQLQNVSLKPAKVQPVVVDERSNLLQAIRIGINLKKVRLLSSPIGLLMTPYPFKSLNVLSPLIVNHSHSSIITRDLRSSL